MATLSIVDDIRKAIHYGSQLGAKVGKEAERYSRKSFARGANDATIQFPCLVSRSCPIDMANSCMRLFDRTYAEFVKIYFSMNSTIDISVDPTPAHYLKKYHQNLSLESVEDPVPEEDKAEFYLAKNKKVGIAYEHTSRGYFDLVTSNEEGLKPVLSEYDLRPFPGMAMEAEGGSQSYYNPPSDEAVNAAMTAMIQKASREEEKEARLDKNQQLGLTQKISAAIATPTIKDADVKKSNDTLPYGVEIKLMAVNGNQEFVNYMTFIVGVKAVLHPIDSEDMMENIIKTLSNSSNVFNFIRWTTGEISFFKDFLFNIKNIRDDIRGKSSTGNPYFAALRRARNAGVSASHLGVHKMIPNATIIITDSECEYLKTKGYDLTKPKIAKILISKLFLMTFVILDEASRTISILYDGSDDFQVYSIEALEKDVAMSSSKLSKEIGRMIAY